MHTVPTSNISAEELALLQRFSQNEAGPELRNLLAVIQELLHEGAEFISLSTPTEKFTLNQAAAILNMSRTHLYALVDREEIMSHNVGRDRRIRAIDLAVFEKRLHRNRQELTDRFATQQATRSQAIDEIIELC